MNLSRFCTRLAKVLMLLLIGLPIQARAQERGHANSQLFDQIAALDRDLFEAFNSCKLDQVEAFFMPDLEFYHEKGGLIVTAKNAVNVMRKTLCGKDNNKVRRELVVGSLAVFPINDFGAVETGEHRFYITQKGKPETLDGIGRFIHIWKLKDGEWKISRIVSYGFRSP